MKSVGETNHGAINHIDEHRARQGVVYGMLAYGLWGLIPLYFKLLTQVAPVEVLAQRVFWSFVFLSIVISLARRWSDLRPALRSWQIVLTLAVSTLLLALNWFTFIYAVSINRVVDASLGYFLTPLVNVLIGVAILKERLRPWQIASVALAAIGVAMLGVPLIAVSLAVTFGCYGLLRKRVAVDGLLGLYIETTLLLPLALGYIVWIESVGRAAFVASDPRTCGVLAASGIVTAVPLLLFTGAARRLRFATLGFLQYIAPTVQFALAVTLFGESLSPEKLTAFALIWAAVGLYCYDSLRSLQSRREAASQPVIVDA